MRHYRNPLAAIVTALALGAALTGCSSLPMGTTTGLSNGTTLNTAMSKVDALSAASKPGRVINFVTVSGVVSELLPDDTVGNPHQLFRFKATVKGQLKTIQVAHNTALAPYVPLKVGDAVEIKGEYIEEKPYDILHWTHYNPRGGDGGYISHKGKKYDKI
ncbi:hypothetical protein D3C87_1115710 [compost metagenome]